MKKFGLLFLLLFIVATLFVFVLRQEEEGADPSYFLPPETAIYLDHRELEESINFFRSSKLGKTIESLDYELLFRQFDLYESHYPTFADIRDEIKAFLDSQLYKQILSKRAVISLLPTKNKSIDNPLSEAKRRLLFILEPKLNSSIIDLISGLNLEGTEQTSTEYGERTIKFHHLSEDERLVTAKVEEHILVSYNEDLIRQSIDRYDGETKESLYYNKEFKEHRQLHDNFRLFFYSSIQQVRNQVPIFINSLENKQKKLIEDQLQDWKGWQSASFGARQVENTIYDKAAIFFDPKKIDKTTRNLFLVPPQSNETLKNVPANVVSYFWANTFDFKSLWDAAIQDKTITDKERREMVQDLRKNLGTDPEALAKILGNQLAFLIRQGTDIGFIPLPECGLFIQLKDPATADKLIRKQLKKLNIPLQTQYYKKKKLVYWDSSIQNSLQPVYCLCGNYLFIASTVELMKKIIDTEESGDGLKKEAAFKVDGNKQFFDKNNSMSFIRFDSFIQLTKELVNWGGILLGLQDRSVSYKSKLLIDQLINPLLDGMTMFSTVHARSYSTSDRVYFENQTRIHQTQTKPAN